MGLQCPDGAQKARAPALPGARVVATDIPLFLFTSQLFSSATFQRQKKKNQTNKKTQHFSHASLSLHLHLITASPSRPLQPCSVFFFLFFPADLFFVVVFCPLVSSTVCHVSATKQRNQSVSCRAEGREGVRVGGGGVPPSEANRGAYLFIQVRSATRKIPCPASSAAPKCRSVRLPGSFAPS